MVSKGREQLSHTTMSYMEDLLTRLREDFGLSEDAIEAVHAELIRSFKNGLQRGREKQREGAKRGNPRGERPGRS